MGRKAVDSNMLFIDNLRVPEGDLIGNEGDGFRYLLHGLNPERILIAAEAIASGRLRCGARRTQRERVVFGRPIGQNQSIQHPLAQAWMQLEAAWLMVMKAATRYDGGSRAARRPTPRNTSAREAAFQACQTAVRRTAGWAARRNTMSSATCASV